MLKDTVESWDDRRDLFIASDSTKAIEFATEHWIHCAQRAIQQRNRFVVALSGGSTPKLIYKTLTKSPLDWTKIWLFWSDERAVPINHPDSNYKMAMDSGFANVPIPQGQIFRMQAENQIDAHAQDYEEKIRRYLDAHLFDLVMLGVGEDGHTASLFPNSYALNITDRYVASNFLADKKGSRMTLTFPCINQSRMAVIYALGASKQFIIPKVLEAAIDSPFPASYVGTCEHKALWILDAPAAAFIHE